MILLTILIITTLYFFIKKLKKTGRHPGRHVKRQVLKTRDSQTPQSQAAQWNDIRDKHPRWYASIDIITPDGVIHEKWARVSNGDHDYYVSTKDDELSLVIPKIKKWRYNE